MLTETKRVNIPGYTGHMPEELDYDSGLGQKEARGHIPGYSGYVPAVKAENLFGSTYGKTSYQSSAGTFSRGSDHPAELRYRSMVKDQFVNQKDVFSHTAAAIVGVQRNPETYKKPIPPETLHKFWGIENKESDELV
jgi:hypothetical protein